MVMRITKLNEAEFLVEEGSALIHTNWKGLIDMILDLDDPVIDPAQILRDIASYSNGATWDGEA